MSDRGWICPRCDIVHAPSILKCACVPAKTLSPEEQLMKSIKDSFPVTPDPHPSYPYWPSYPGPGVIYTTGDIKQGLVDPYTVRIG